MSAAAARRRKQLASRRSQSGGGEEEGGDVVTLQLEKLLSSDDMDEATAYESLQLAQSLVRKRVSHGQFGPACDLAYSTSLKLLQAHRVSVASQLLSVLVQVLRETHTEETDQWLERLEELQTAHAAAMDHVAKSASNEEALRLQRLQREWLRACVGWSSDLGKTQLGNKRFYHLLASLSWKLSFDDADSSNAAGLEPEEDYVSELQVDAIQHCAVAERPDQILEWLAALPDPTDAETKVGHTCAPALRDGLLTRATLVFVAMENLRDANTLVRGYIKKIEKRDIKALAKSYTNKEDGKAPSHVMFCCMLLRVCEKDVRTGPLYSWLLRSFKREMDLLYKPNHVWAFTVKIGKVYFNIQPPPSMLNMLENMMGGGGAGGFGGPGGINPAMMQAAMAQMQGMM